MKFSDRFVVRFNNGTWKTFDLWLYQDVEVFPRKVDAEERLVEVAPKE
jgi:hypothetical protein